jgi:peptidylprolyl isomerase
MLIPALVACGGEEKKGYGDETVSGFDGVTVSAAVDKEPTLKWKSPIAYPEDPKVKTLTEGEGEEIPEGRGVFAKIYIGNATTLDKEWAYESQAPEGEELPAEKPWSTILKGAKVGDRIEAIVGSADLLGEGGNPQMGIGNHDTLLVVLDVVKPAADKAPKDVDAVLKRVIVTEGDGEEITTDQTVTANYLGMTYGAKKPFDESFSKEAVPFALNQVVPGWTNGLEGVKVGSRVLLQIPPELGYGAEEKPGQGGTPGIPANSTLYFVIDVIKADDTPAQQ